MREALWRLPVHNVFPYMKYLHSFVSRPRLVKASGDWIAYSTVVRNNSVVVRKHSAKFVVLISLNEATWITSRVLHLACGQETSAARNFLRDRLRERVFFRWKLFQAFEICLPFKSMLLSKWKFGGKGCWAVGLLLFLFHSRGKPIYGAARSVFIMRWWLASWRFLHCYQSGMEFYEPSSVQLHGVTRFDPDLSPALLPNVDRYGFVGNHKQAS